MQSRQVLTRLSRATTGESNGPIKASRSTLGLRTPKRVTLPAMGLTSLAHRHTLNENPCYPLPQSGQRDSVEAWLCSKANRGPFCISDFGTLRTSESIQVMSAFGAKRTISNNLPRYCIVIRSERLKVEAFVFSGSLGAFASN